MQSPSDFRWVCRFEKELQGLDEVAPRRFNRLTLAGDIELRAERHVRTVLAFNDRGQVLGGLYWLIVTHGSNPSTSSTRPNACAIGSTPRRASLPEASSRSTRSGPCGSRCA